jgi:predicted RND superfamily exporter protein
MFSPFSSNEFLLRPLRLLIIGGSVLLLVFCVWSATEARKLSSNRVVDWIPKGTKELAVFRDRYYRHFPEGEYLLVSWKGCTIDDTRLDTLAEKLVAPFENGSPPHFARAMTTRSVLEILTNDVPQRNKTGAKSRLTGWLIGQDQKTACLVLVPHPEGWQPPAVAVKFLFTTIEQTTGLSSSDIYIAGTGIDSVAINEIAEKAQRTLLPFFLLFSLFLLLCCLRHFFAAIIVFWIAMINEELAGTLLFWCGAHVDSISMLISALAYVLTISGGIHLINYYKETLAEMEPGEEKHAPMQTFHKAILPCSLAILTTILGIGSLAVSRMVPIQTFGIYASLTLFLGTIFLFFYILSALQERPVKRWFPDSLPSEMPETSRRDVWRVMGNVLFRWRYPITMLAFLSLAVFATGIQGLRTSVTFHGLLPKDAKVLQDYHTLEHQIGGLIPIEVVVHFPDEGEENRKMLDQLHYVKSLTQTLAQMDDVSAVISVLNFIPDLPSKTDGGWQTVARRAAMEGELNRKQNQLRELCFFNTVSHEGADSGNYWRISLRVPAHKRLDYALLIAEVEKRLESVRQTDNGPPNVRFDVTGGIPLVFLAQTLLLWDLINSFTMAFCLITLTMMIVLRGVVRGLLAMIPNFFPCVIVFGMLGLYGIPIDMGSMMTASVALGISVDGTLHLLTWTNIALRRGLPRKEAVFYALHRCCTALLQTAVICGIGMLIFGWSDFVPVSRFAVLLCIILGVSLIGDIIVLPAILFSPLGRFFDLTEKDKKSLWRL